MTLTFEYIMAYIHMAVRDPEVEFAVADFVDKYKAGKVKIK